MERPGRELTMDRDGQGPSRAIFRNAPELGVTPVGGDDHDAERSSARMTSPAAHPPGTSGHQDGAEALDDYGVHGRPRLHTRRVHGDGLRNPLNALATRTPVGRPDLVFAAPHALEKIPLVGMLLRSVDATATDDVGPHRTPIEVRQSLHDLALVYSLQPGRSQVAKDSGGS
jgi:hypothetical protein